MHLCSGGSGWEQVQKAGTGQVDLHLSPNSPSAAVVTAGGTTCNIHMPKELFLLLLG